MTEIAADMATDHSSSSNTTSPQAKTEMDPEQLLVAVRNQIEYYFSKDNLRSDTFLLSQMDSQNSVPLATVMSFAKLRALTQDENLVIEALQNSSSVSYADGRIKTLAKSGRSTIILREIPSDAPEEKVKEIFSFPGCKPIASVRSEIGDTWFITMESEEDAKDTLMDLKLKKRTFDGAPVKARLKSEAVVRSYYSTPGPMGGPMGAYPGMPFAPYAAGNMQADGVGGGPFGYGPGSASQQGPDGSRDNRRQNRQHSDGEKSSPNSRSGGRYHDKNHGNDGEGSPRRDRRSNSHGGPSGGKGRDRDGNRKGGHGKGHGRERRDGQGTGGSQQQATPAIEINSSADFPPLPPQGTEEVGSAPSSPTTIPARGFQGPYTKYSMDDIIQIVTSIKEAILPDTIRPEDHPAAMSVTPNTDLLLRQRTFSIDETREQMQQGRPVQREAILAGAVDYGSLLYGEDYQQGQGQQQGGKKSEGGSWVGVLKNGGAPDAFKPPAAKKNADKAGGSATASNTTAAPSSGGEKRTEGGKKKPSTESGRREEGSNSSRKTEKKEKGQGRDRRRQDGSNKTQGGNSEGQTATPSSWGGRPTFANVLKQKEAEEAAAKEKEASSRTAPAGEKPTENKPVESKSAPSGANTSHRNKDTRNVAEKNNRSNAPHYHKKTTPHGSAADGTWSKEKLPPLPREREAS